MQDYIIHSRDRISRRVCYLSRVWLVLHIYLQKRRENVCQSLNIETPETSYADILQRLVRRYLFKLERLKMEGECKQSLFLIVHILSDMHTDLFYHILWR